MADSDDARALHPRPDLGSIGLPSRVQVFKALSRFWSGWRGRPQAGGVRVSDLPVRRRLEIGIEPDCIYAIGDIHGCLDKLLELEHAIIEDARSIEGSKLLIFLGDYIDRGPASAEVLDHLLMDPPPSFERIWICGNHEEALLDCIDGRLGLDDWLNLGGDRTLLSYSYDIRYMMKLRHVDETALIRQVAATIPQRHQTFLRQLPASFATPSRLFVHAGVRPGIPLAEQSDRDLLCIRGAFLNGPDPGLGRLIVHGHTPAKDPVRLPWRIGVDTGAYMGGPLTAVRLMGDEVSFIQTP